MGGSKENHAFVHAEVDRKVVTRFPCDREERASEERKEECVRW